MLSVIFDSSSDTMTLSGNECGEFLSLLSRDTRTRVTFVSDTRKAMFISECQVRLIIVPSQLTQTKMYCFNVCKRRERMNKLFMERMLVLVSLGHKD